MNHLSLVYLTFGPHKVVFFSREKMLSQNYVINDSLNICKETNFELILETSVYVNFNIFWLS